MKKPILAYLDGASVPEDLIREAARPIQDYSVFLASLQTTKKGQILVPIGSGTLISCGSIYGIATAHHVVSDNAYKCADKIALVIGGSADRVMYSPEILAEIIVGKPDPLENKPDLAFIKLPNDDTDWLKAKKSFWNLDVWRRRIMETEFPKDAGLWFISGAAIKMIGVKSENTSTGEIMTFPGILAHSGAPDFHEHGEYDYYEFQVNIPGADNRQNDFRGVSGGGIWQVILVKMGDDRIRAVVRINFRLQLFFLLGEGH